MSRFAPPAQSRTEPQRSNSPRWRVGISWYSAGRIEAHTEAFESERDAHTYAASVRQGVRRLARDVVIPPDAEFIDVLGPELEGEPSSVLLSESERETGRQGIAAARAELRKEAS